MNRFDALSAWKAVIKDRSCSQCAWQLWDHVGVGEGNFKDIIWKRKKKKSEIPKKTEIFHSAAYILEKWSFPPVWIIFFTDFALNWLTFSAPIAVQWQNKWTFPNGTAWLEWRAEGPANLVNLNLPRSFDRLDRSHLRRTRSLELGLEM